jgi:galactose mutarotase-like enzyme
MGFPRITAQTDNVLVEVVPDRGCLTTRLRVDGHDVLWLDPSTVDDVTKSVRGGIPVLFPFAGKLAGDHFVDASTVITQHGFARGLPWTLSEQRPGLLRFQLLPTPDTLKIFPHQFVLEQTLLLLPRGLHIEMTVQNTGTTPMPLSPGWHPYFPCPDAQKQHIKTDVPGLDPMRFTPEATFDFGVPPAAHGRARFELPGLGTLWLSHTPQMRHLQCWGLPGRDFVCLEPFWGPNNTINTPARAVLPPGQGTSVWMRMEVGL